MITHGNDYYLYIRTYCASVHIPNRRTLGNEHNYAVRHEVWGVGV
jgi:hypothetical protein